MKATDDWFTPPWLLEIARECLGGGIELDPCSNAVAQTAVLAQKWYGPGSRYATNGLTKPWPRVRTFINPPFSKPAPWAHLAIASAMEGGSVFFVANNATETFWGQSLLKASSWIWFPRKRINFWNPLKPSGNNRYAQMICGLECDPPPFGVEGVVFEK